MREVCKAAIDLIKECEGFSPTPYLCPAGKPTIGYGHTGGVALGNHRITEAMAEELLRADLESAQRAVEHLVKVPLTDDQYGALVSFTFNLGSGALQSSTLLELINRGRLDLAGEQFQRWNKAVVNGQRVVLPGLVTRRRKEAELWNGGHDHGDAL